MQFHQLLLSSERGIASSSNIYLGFCQIKRRTGITMRNVADMLRATHQLTWPWYCPFLQAPWYSSPSPYWKHLRRVWISDSEIYENTTSNNSWGPAYHLNRFSCRWCTGRCTRHHWATQTWQATEGKWQKKAGNKINKRKLAIRSSLTCPGRPSGS